MNNFRIATNVCVHHQRYELYAVLSLWAAHFHSFVLFIFSILCWLFWNTIPGGFDHWVLRLSCLYSKCRNWGPWIPFCPMVPHVRWNIWKFIIQLGSRYEIDDDHHVTLFATHQDITSGDIHMNVAPLVRNPHSKKINSQKKTGVCSSWSVNKSSWMQCRGTIVRVR
jgi:hypothetical protein